MSVQQEKNLSPILSESAQVDQQSVQPFPRSQKVYVQGSRPDIRVPMREISLDRLRTLVAIADLGSFAEAARVLH
ncbi:hypothetical protein, partial [Escherichia coli]